MSLDSKGLLLKLLALWALHFSQGVSSAPRYDHIVVVVLENSGYAQVIGSTDAPFINQQLVKGGVSISNAFGEQHPSQPNYYWLFSGSNQGITTDDAPWPSSDPGPVFDTNNLWLELRNNPPSPNFFFGYVDSGSKKPVTDVWVDTDTYATKHVPWLGFTNIFNGNPAAVTRDFGLHFPKTADGFKLLPTVSFVIPALNHDMHSYNKQGDSVANYKESRKAVRTGDAWLRKNLWNYAKWAKTHNSLLIITFDEDSTADWPTPVSQGGGGVNGGTNPEGMTSPIFHFQQSDDTSGPNQIPMVFYGSHLSKKGRYTLPDRVGVNNINLLRTIESFYRLGRSGAQYPLALASGMDDGPIFEIFDHDCVVCD